MERQIVELKRVSICPCGYPVLQDSIAVGTRYVVDWSTARERFTYVCGKCRRRQTVQVVDASSALNPDAPMLPLPVDLFIGVETA